MIATIVFPMLVVIVPAVLMVAMVVLVAICSRLVGLFVGGMV